MADYLLDTNHLSPLVTIGHVLRDEVLNHIETGTTFGIAMPVLTEFLYGIQLLPRANANIWEWNHLQNRFDYYEIDRHDAESAATLQVSLCQRGRQLATVDALIASIALRYDLILLTTDRDFEPIPNLQQENWLSNCP